MQRISLSLVILSVAFALPVHAQGSDITRGENPFQEEYDYEVEQRLDLNIQIDALIVRSLRINAGDPQEFVAGENVKTFIYLEIENPSESSASISTILLLEDAQGSQLERVELKTVKVSSGDAKESEMKVKLDGRTLRELAKVYIFAEVS